MPRVLAREPAWLARETPGFQLFRSADAASHQGHQITTTTYEGPSRKIAYRAGEFGSELFVAVGKELRWSEVGMIKDAAEEAAPADEALRKPVYRVIKVTGTADIQQLLVSPSGEYLAVLTAHTCRVLIIPSSSHLQSRSSDAISPKSFQVGPTAHVNERAPLATALWHPLSPTGNCLLTVTQDSCVRMWELDKGNRSTFDEPSLAVDLRKLASAGTMRDDLGASKYGANRRFSPDDEEMQAAGACFGGAGMDDEHGWAGMTLWVAMTEGDVYALCPFLPSKWFAPSTMIPSLTTSVMAKSRAMAGGDVSGKERMVADQQMSWLSDVDEQDPIPGPGAQEFDTTEVYARPTHPGAIPKLQGPFCLSPEPDFGEITDIHVVAPKLDDEALYDEDYEDPGMKEGLSLGVVCLATTTSKVFVCLDTEGVEAEWLPMRRARSFTLDDDDDKSLLLFETVDLTVQGAEQNGWPTFTRSPIDRYEVFVTTPVGVHSLSFAPWVGDLEAELSSPADSGVEFRIDNVFLETATTNVDQPLRLPSEPDRRLNAAVAIVDSRLGYMILTCAADVPYLSVLERASASQSYAPDDTNPFLALPAPEPRAPYQPAEEFFRSSELPQMLKATNDSDPRGRLTKSELRFSPAVLKLMTDTHRILGDETHKLGLAAADLFRRCERMRAELEEQIRRVQEISSKVDKVVGEADGDNDDASPDTDDAPAGNERIEQRLLQAESKTAQLNARTEDLRQKMKRLGGRELSVKEKALAKEVAMVQKTVRPVIATGDDLDDSTDAPLPPSSSAIADEDDDDEEDASLATRFHAVQAMLDPLSSQAEKALAARTQPHENGETKSESAASASANAFKRQKVDQVWLLLERQKAMVEALGERMRRMGVGEGL
nr:nucleoporin nup82 [Quercus suber]